MLNKNLIFLLYLFLTSCVGYHYTNEGGIRVDNPKVFKYNKKRFRSLDKSLIDTNAVYVLSRHSSMWDSLWFIRFFPTGQVLFVPCDSMQPALSLINNKNVGFQGYFIIQGTRIKIDMFQELNGGQTGKYFGRIEPDGNISFYESRPETSYSIYYLVKKMGNANGMSHWKKVPVDKMEHYVPDW